MLLGTLVLQVGACASGTPTPHPELRSLWRDYRELPDERALAIAGDLARGRWVAGAVGGHASAAAAEQAALGECRLRRARARMQDACFVYAIGDEVVTAEAD